MASERDTVRLMVGDTDEADPILSDAELDTFIDYRQFEDTDGNTVTNLPAAAADAAAAIAAGFAREFNFAEDGQRFDRAQKYAHYVSLEQSLRRRQGGSGGVPADYTSTS
jgi:hypothetical protein